MSEKLFPVSSIDDCSAQCLAILRGMPLFSYPVFVSAMTWSRKPSISAVSAATAAV